MNWRYFDSTEEACNYLKENDYTINAVEQIEGSVTLNEYPHKEKSAYIFGNEVDGVDDEILQYCDNAIEIPQEGTKHSLNVSITAGIVMYDIFNALWKK